MIRMQVLGHKDGRSETQDYSHVSDKEVIMAIQKAMPDITADEDQNIPAEDHELNDALKRIKATAAAEAGFRAAVLAFASGCRKSQESDWAAGLSS